MAISIHDLEMGAGPVYMMELIDKSLTLFKSASEMMLVSAPVSTMPSIRVRQSQSESRTCDVFALSINLWIEADIRYLYDCLLWDFLKCYCQPGVTLVDELCAVQDWWWNRLMQLVNESQRSIIALINFVERMESMLHVAICRIYCWIFY